MKKNNNNVGGGKISFEEAMKRVRGGAAPREVEQIVEGMIGRPYFMPGVHRKRKRNMSNHISICDKLYL